MVRYGIFVTADLGNLTNLQPAGGSATPFHLKVKCGKCGQLGDLMIYFEQKRTPESTPHVSKKCVFCDSMGSVRAHGGTPALTEEDLSGVQLMELEFDGCDPVSFLFGGGWKAENPKSRVIFDVDLTGGDFSVYDDKGKCWVSVFNARASITVLPTNVKNVKKVKKA